MATSTSSGFVPLVTEQPNGYDGRTQGQSGTEAGASGDSSSAMTLSSGGLIAIIIVVVVVSIVGGKFLSNPCSDMTRETYKKKQSLICNTQLLLLRCSLLPKSASGLFVKPSEDLHEKS